MIRKKKLQSGVVHLLPIVTLLFLSFLVWALYRQSFDIRRQAATGERTPPPPTCQPRPACLDERPSCKIPEPVEGWCPDGVVDNHNPVVKTNNLPSGTVNRKYSTNVEGYDLDTDDNLSMEILHLPPGLTQGSCREKVAKGKNPRKTISCKIEGKPKEVGDYFISVVLKDNHNATDTKTLNLTVNSKGIKLFR